VCPTGTYLKTPHFGSIIGTDTAKLAFGIVHFSPVYLTYGTTVKAVAFNVWYVHEVVISCGAEVIARHPRCYEREAFVFERARSIGAGQAADREFDAAAGEFAPGFDFRHVGRLRELREIGARFDPCLAALERIGLAPPSALA
jgi:hypothetical protein